MASTTKSKSINIITNPLAFEDRTRSASYELAGGLAGSGLNRKIFFEPDLTSDLSGRAGLISETVHFAGL